MSTGKLVGSVCESDDSIAPWFESRLILDTEYSKLEPWVNRHTL